MISPPHLLHVVGLWTFLEDKLPKVLLCDYLEHWTWQRFTSVLSSNIAFYSVRYLIDD